jgi:peptide/nickel transport system permease protein
VTSTLTAFAARRALAALVLVAVVSTAAFALTRLAAGDETIEMRQNGADAVTIAETRARLGLDLPATTQIGQWIGGVLRFDLGRSSEFGVAVAPLAARRAANTALLAATALALAIMLGVPIGVLVGAHPRGWLARLVTPISIAFVSCPPIVGALGLLWLAVSTGWLSIAPGSLAVPALALGLPLAATIERLLSQATTEALGATDVVAAEARGLSSSRIMWRHAARQSLTPLLAVAGVTIGSVFSGSLAVEVVTSWPGLGRLMYDALTGRDVFLAAGCALVGALVLAAGNFIADVTRAVVDPRIRVERSGGRPGPRIRA